MATFGHVPLVEVTRGSIVETVHYGSLCLADALAEFASATTAVRSSP